MVRLSPGELDDKYGDYRRKRDKREAERDRQREREQESGNDNSSNNGGSSSGGSSSRRSSGGSNNNSGSLPDKFKDAGSKGSKYAKIKRNDGSVQIVDRSGRIVYEQNKQGQSVIRVDSTPNKGGGSSKNFRQVTDQKTAAKQDRINKRRQEIGAQKRFVDKAISAIEDQQKKSSQKKAGSPDPYPLRDFQTRSTVSNDPNLKGQGTISFQNEVYLSPNKEFSRLTERKSPEDQFYSVVDAPRNPIASPEAVRLLESEKDRLQMIGTNVNEKELNRLALSRIFDDKEKARTAVEGNIVSLTEDQKFEAQFNPTLKTWTPENFRNIGKFWRRESEQGRNVKQTVSDAKQLGKQLFTAEELKRQAVYATGTGVANTVPARVGTFGPGDIIDAGFAIPDIAAGILFPTRQRKAVALLETVDIAADIVPINKPNFRFGNVRSSFDPSISPGLQRRFSINNPNKGSVSSSGSASGSISQPNTSSRGTARSSSEFQTSNVFGNDFDIDFFDNTNFRRSNINIDGNINKNSEININENINNNAEINPNFNENSEININPNLDINANPEINLNQNINQNVNANVNANQNAFLNANVNSNLNPNLNFNANFNRRQKKRKPRSRVSRAYEYKYGRRASDEFSNNNLLAGAKRAARIVDTTSSSKFSVKGLSGNKVSDKQLSSIGRAIGNKFRPGTKRGTFVEKEQFRNDSIGERIEKNQRSNNLFNSENFSLARSLQGKGFSLRGIRRFLR